MLTVKVINDIGCRALKEWIEKTSIEGYCSTDQRAIEAWCQEAEEAMGNGNPPIVEMSHLHTISGVTETFTVPDEGVRTEEIEE